MRRPRLDRWNADDVGRLKRAGETVRTALDQLAEIAPGWRLLPGERAIA